MFSFYSDSDVKEMGDALEKVLADYAMIPPAMQMHIMTWVGTDLARKLATAAQKNERTLHEPDLVNNLETWAGVIDHTSPTIQCRGETTMHRCFEEANARADRLEAELATLRGYVADLETQVTA